ncbi:hypothetical protein [Thermodesulfatator atlanticus]
MLRLVIVSAICASALLANNISTEEQYHKGRDKSYQKATDSSQTTDKSVQKSKEKGRELTKGKESVKSKEFEKSVAIEKSKSKSEAKSIKRTVEMAATFMMPEVDRLIERLMATFTKYPRGFLDNLPVKESDYPPTFRALMEYEDMQVAANPYFYAKKYRDENVNYTLSYKTPDNVLTPVSTNMAAYSNATALMKSFSRKYTGLFNYFFKVYGLPFTSIDVRTHEIPKYNIALEFYKVRFYADATGEWQGNFVFTLKNFFVNDLKFFSKRYILQAVPHEGRFLLLRNSNPVIEISPLRELHFYGDLIFLRDFGGEFSNKNITVLDRKINADGIKLNMPNPHNKFDDYFKKLMKLYIEAFSSIGISKNESYSLEEIRYRAREYLYRKTTGKNDFLKCYLSEKSDFWRPKGEDLITLPNVSTSYNDIVYSKQDGILLNRRIVFQIETADSIQQNFNRLIREAKNKRFAQSIKKAVNQFIRENRQDAARLVMQLSLKLLQSENFTLKQDLISKATTSTDVLQNLLNLVK